MNPYSGQIPTSQLSQSEILRRQARERDQALSRFDALQDQIMGKNEALNNQTISQSRGVEALLHHARQANAFNIQPPVFETINLGPTDFNFNSQDFYVKKRTCNCNGRTITTCIITGVGLMALVTGIALASIYGNSDLTTGLMAGGGGLAMIGIAINLVKKIKCPFSKNSQSLGINNSESSDTEPE